MVEPGRRLEDEPALAAAANELRELLDRAGRARRRSGSSRAGRAPRPRRAARPRGRPRRPAARCRADHRERATLVLRQLRELRGRPDEPPEQPRVLALPRAPVLGERLGRRQARRREHRRVVEEPRQERAAGVVRHEARGYTGRRARPRAVGACEPRQIREEAALSSPSQVCGSPGPFARFARSAFGSAFRSLDASGFAARLLTASACVRARTCRARRRGRIRGRRSLLESLHGCALPEVPSADLRGRRRAGGGRPDAEQRDLGRRGAPGLPLRRPARHRQDLDGAHPRQVPQLRAGADDDARRHVPRVPRDRRRARRST